MGDGGIRVCLVTGATGAIGKSIARQIAGRPDTEVVLACRDEKKAGQTVREIVETTGNPRVRFELVDVSRKASVHALAERWRGPLHVLVNDAAVDVSTGSYGSTVSVSVQIPLSNVMLFSVSFAKFTGTIQGAATIRCE